MPRTFADLQQHVAWSFLAAVPAARRHFYDLCTRFPATMAKRTRMRCIAQLRRNVRDNLLSLMLEPMGSPISVARAIGHVGEQIGAAKEPRAQALEGEPVVQHEQEQEEEEQQQQVEQEEEENGDGAALTAPAARESGSRMKLESPAADSGNSSDGGGADQADTHDHGVDNSSNSDADDDDDDDDDDERSDETQNNNEARRDQTEESNNGDDTNNNNNDPDNNSSNDPDNNSSDDTGSSCFAADATVQLKDGRTIAMRDLCVGDHVLTSDGTHHEVTAWLHRCSGTTRGNPVTFTRITARASVLSLTASHYIAVVRNGCRSFVPAGAVVVGDRLVDAHGGTRVVCSVEEQRRCDGYFAPYVPQGTVVVCGVVAHVFAEVAPTRALVLAHRALMAGHRVVCGGGSGGGKGSAQPDNLVHPLSLSLLKLMALVCPSLRRIAIRSECDNRDDEGDTCCPSSAAI